MYVDKCMYKKNLTIKAERTENCTVLVGGLKGPTNLILQ